MSVVPELMRRFVGGEDVGNIAVRPYVFEDDIRRISGGKNVVGGDAHVAKCGRKMARFDLLERTLIVAVDGSSGKRESVDGVKQTANGKQSP